MLCTVGTASAGCVVEKGGGHPNRGGRPPLHAVPLSQSFNPSRVVPRGTVRVFGSVRLDRARHVAEGSKDRQPRPDSLHRVRPWDEPPVFSVNGHATTSWLKNTCGVDPRKRPFCAPVFNGTAFQREGRSRKTRF